MDTLKQIKSSYDLPLTHTNSARLAPDTDVTTARKIQRKSCPGTTYNDDEFSNEEISAGLARQHSDDSGGVALTTYEQLMRNEALANAEKECGEIKSPGHSRPLSQRWTSSLTGITSVKSLMTGCVKPRDDFKNDFISGIEAGGSDDEGLDSMLQNSDRMSMQRDVVNVTSSDMNELNLDNTRDSELSDGSEIRSSLVFVQNARNQPRSASDGLITSVDFGALLLDSDFGRFEQDQASKEYRLAFERYLKVTGNLVHLQNYRRFAEVHRNLALLDLKGSEDVMGDTMNGAGQGGLSESVLASRDKLRSHLETKLIPTFMESEEFQSLVD